MASRAPQSYLAASEAEGRLQTWSERADATGEELLFNNMEPPAFGKFVALPALLGQLRGEFGLSPRMSGSGSACFALLDEAVPVAAVTASIRNAWGPTSFVIETSIA
eukprot:gene197-241_t